MQFTKEVCKDKGFEKKILKAFKNGVTYNVLNDKLYMNIDPGTVYIFRRIRR
jgi:heat shock protein HslJ